MANLGDSPPSVLKTPQKPANNMSIPPSKLGAKTTINELLTACTTTYTIATLSVFSTGKSGKTPVIRQDMAHALLRPMLFFETIDCEGRAGQMSPIKKNPTLQIDRCVYPAWN